MIFDRAATLSRSDTHSYRVRLDNNAVWRSLIYICRFLSDLSRHFQATTFFSSAYLQRFHERYSSTEGVSLQTVLERSLIRTHLASILTQVCHLASGGASCPKNVQDSQNRI